MSDDRLAHMSYRFLVRWNRTALRHKRWTPMLGSSTRNGGPVWIVAQWLPIPGRASSRRRLFPAPWYAAYHRGHWKADA